MRIAVIGHGKMGKMIEAALLEKGVEIAGIVDVDLIRTLREVPGTIDVAMDFSHPDNLSATLSAAVERGVALVIGTTGLSERQSERIARAAERVPVVWSSNYSTGVAVLRRALQMVAPVLKDDFDIEIVETHHNQKADAPSGTAKMLLKAVDPDGEFAVVNGRVGMTGKRGKEIGVHALRGGTMAGEHSVFFFGRDETLEFRHTAASRQIFVTGAVRAALFAAGRAPGLYTMDDVLFPGT